MSEILLTYINGNLSYARDEFWNSSKLTQRDVMLEALDLFEDDIHEGMTKFIRVIFLP